MNEGLLMEGKFVITGSRMGFSLLLYRDSPLVWINDVALRLLDWDTRSRNCLDDDEFECTIICFISSLCSSHEPAAAMSTTMSSICA